ncbi:hypothetical protein SAMN05216331_16211 [Porphyromonadaceae bacterium KH3R12]|nr:hypothetical protein SAMN05216331_16211 [Porphyromonadaceae bacterium KH3R12]
MKQLKKLELKRKTVETLGKPGMSNLRGGGNPSTITGTTCDFNTPPPKSEFLSCA